MFFKGHFQNAYITHDYEKAKKLLSDTFGLEDWQDIDAVMQLKAPDGIKDAACKVGLVWQGGFQLELIQPISGYSAHYDPVLPADKSDPTPAFHHICMRRDDLDAMRREIDELGKLGVPFAFEGTVPDETGETAMVYAYLDAREKLGHFIEYIWATPGMWEWQRWPNEKPVF
jgi:catechol 2,3-dioxygenase-like lactoylglutathione lyase family enzyme